ncbi:MAG: tRNA pseudouridine(55) synthase TruB [Bacteroidota bacterium]
MELFSEHTRDFQAGVLIPVNKPLDWTSFDVVNKIKYLLKYQRNIPKIKIGHAGTLDPRATGLLLICTGKATKQIESLQDMPKTYLATLRLGATTPSFDSETEINQKFPYEHISQEALQNSLKSFTGHIAQTPPDYSALHVNGTRAYKMARKGEKTNLKERQVTIDNIELLKFDKPFVRISVTCHKGTYIRALANDIGKVLDSGAYLEELTRTQIGNYRLEKAYDLEIIEKLLKK